MDTAAVVVYVCERASAVVYNTTNSTTLASHKRGEPFRLLPDLT